MEDDAPTPAAPKGTVPRPGVAGRILQTPLAVPLIHIVSALALAVLSLRLDTALGDWSPAWLRFGEQTARSVTTGFAASFVFVVSVVFWVRLYAVQVAAEPFPGRVRRQFLTDRVHRNAMGFILGALTFTIVVARAVPDGDAGMATVPHVSVAVVCSLAVMVGLTIVYVVHNAARWAEIGRLTRWLAQECVELIRQTHPEHDPSHRDPTQVDGQGAAPTRPPDRTVLAHDSGWIQRVDEDQLLAGMPDGTTVELSVRVGWFVIEGTPLASVWCDGDDAELAETMTTAVTIGPEASFDEDLTYGIQQMVDIGERSMSTGSSDSTTAQEVVLYLGVVLRELLLRDLPSNVLNDAGRRLLKPHEESFEGYVSSALDRIRVAGAGSPDVAMCLLSTIRMLVAELERAGLGDRTEVLHHHAQLVLRAASQRSDMHEDFERVRHAARSWGLGPVDPAGRRLETAERRA